MDEKLYKTYREVEDKHWWFIGRRQLIFNILDKYKLKGKKILDFGCHTGFLVGGLQQKGFDVYGCDNSEEAINFGQAQSIKNLKVCPREKLPYHDQSFDAVLCLDVLEHIKDDKSALQEIKRVLKRKSLVIITVPALKFLWSLQDEVSHHYQRYNKSQIKSLLTETGFKVARATYFNFFLWLPIALVRTTQKIIKPKRSSDFELNNKLTNYLLKRIFLLEVNLLNYFNFFIGISLLLIAQKNER